MSGTKRSSLVRAIGLLAIASVTAGAMAVGPATGAAEFTKKKAKKLFVEDKVFYRRGPVEEIGANTDAELDVDCPTGARAIAGGVYAEASLMYVETSTPNASQGNDLLGHTGWTTWVHNDNGTAYEAQPYVVCLPATKVDSNFPVGEDPRAAFTP